MYRPFLFIVLFLISGILAELITNRLTILELIFQQM